MAFLEGIRNSIGNYFLNKERGVVSRNKGIVNMETAKSIGIVYSLDDIEQVEQVKKYIATLRGKGKKVKSIGYLNQKELPTNIQSSIDQQCFTQKEVNWYYKPATNIIDNFVREEFDILLDLNINSQLPLTFVAALSKGRCKVGKYSEKDKDLYDVMIENKENGSLNYFLTNVDTYMGMLNKVSAAFNKA